MLFYDNTLRAEFIKRNNRFSADVLIDGKQETVHVKNTGRLGELLLPGAEVMLQLCPSPERKTKYDLISVYKPSLGWVNIDSLAPNKLVRQWLEAQDFDYIKPEYSFGESRLDFYMEKAGEKWLLEVKGCTLEQDGVGLFPDAVSERAARHENELSKAAALGYNAVTAFVIAMNGINTVLPNAEKDAEFAECYEKAVKNGVKVWFFQCSVNADSIEIVNKNELKINC